MTHNCSDGMQWALTTRADWQACDGDWKKLLSISAQCPLLLEVGDSIQHEGLLCQVAQDCS